MNAETIKARVAELLTHVEAIEPPVARELLRPIITAHTAMEAAALGEPESTEAGDD